MYAKSEAQMVLFVLLLGSINEASDFWRLGVYCCVAGARRPSPFKRTIDGSKRPPHSLEGQTTARGVAVDSPLEL